MSDDPLTTLRLAIDRADQTLLDALSARLKVVQLIAEIKKVDGIAGVDPAREADLVAAWRTRAVSVSVPPDLAEGILALILEHTRSVVTGDAEGPS
jgi:chorismate mutase